MPSDKSHRVSVRKATQNQAVRSATRTARRKGMSAAQEKDANAPELVKAAVAQLDRAARKHVIHPNKAARHKSQLMRALRQGQAQ